jgi:hypothetical protein
MPASAGVAFPTLNDFRFRHFIAFTACIRTFTGPDFASFA